MIDHAPSFQDSQAIYGQIELLDYSLVFNVMAHRDQLGRHLPEIFHQVILTGKNLSGHNFTKVDIRFREQKNIVTNPAGSADTVIIDMQKSDFSPFDLMLKQTIQSAEPKKRRLIMEYSSSPHKYEYNTTFLIQ